MVTLILGVCVDGRQLMPIRFWHDENSLFGLLSRLCDHLRSAGSHQALPQLARPQPARDFLFAEPVEASRVTALFRHAVPSTMAFSRSRPD
jgi:hypothetical protein